MPSFLLDIAMSFTAHVTDVKCYTSKINYVKLTILMKL